MVLEMLLRRALERWAGRRRRTRGLNTFVLFILPALALCVVAVVYPNIAGAIWSFTDWNGLSQHRSFNGLANIRQLFRDAQAHKALINSLLVAVVVPPLQTGIGLVFALALNTGLKTRNMLRTILFAPVVLPPIVVAFLWQYLYAPDGAINSLLKDIGLGREAQTWLGNPNLALWSIMIVIVWQMAGISMAIFLAGLQTVPKELLEAASMDGAGPIRRFAHIVLPLLTPALIVSLLLSTITCLKLFDQIFAMTGGGPAGATEVLATYQYKQAFTFGQFGYGSTIALALSVIIVFFVSLQYALIRRRGRKVA